MLTIDDQPGRFRITRRWFSYWNLLGLAFFTFFVYLVVRQALRANPPDLAAVSWKTWVMAMVGLCGWYAELAGVFNRTVIEVRGGELTVRHGPIPWVGRRRLRTGDIAQLYCTTRTPVFPRRDREHDVRYELWAQRPDGTAIRVIAGLNDENLALELEQRLEDHLGIEHRSVLGGLPR